MSALNIQLITTEADFRSLEPEWTALHNDARGTIFESFRWLSGWWDIYRRPNLRLRIAAVRDDGALVGILPTFIDETRFGPFALRRLRLLGTFDVYGEYAPFFLPGRDADVLPFLARFCTDELKNGSIDVITLFRFDATSPAMGALIDGIGKANVRLRYEPSEIVRVMMALPGDWETYTKSLSSAEQEILRRRSRSLEKNGVELETISEPSDADFDDFVRLHTASWTGRGIAGYFSSPQFEAFHRSATADFMRARQARLYFFRKDGVRFAAVHAYFMHDQCCFYLSGLDREHEYVRFSPGKVLLSYVIRDAIRMGCTTFDFQGGTEEYKFKLGGKASSFGKAVVWGKGLSSVKVVPLLGLSALYNFLVGGVWAYQILPRVRTLGGLFGFRPPEHVGHSAPQERRP